MADYVKGVVVAFDRDVREEEAERIISAIRMVKHVVDVRPVVADIDTELAEGRVNAKWREKLNALICEDLTGRKRDYNG